jgi:glycosyltransferase involved in cell wall biosynthesis
MKPVKVALFTTYYPRHDRDHAGLFVSELVQEVTARGVEVTVVAPGVYNDYGLAYGVGVARNIKRRPWRLPLMIFSAWRALRKAARHADVVHIHWLLASPLGLLCKKPWVLTLHGTPTAGRFEDLVLLTLVPGVCGLAGDGVPLVLVQVDEYRVEGHPPQVRQARDVNAELGGGFGGITAGQLLILGDRTARSQPPGQLAQLGHQRSAPG